MKYFVRWQNLWYSNNSFVNFVARHGVYFSRMHSPIGLNTQLCCERYSLSLYRFSCITESWLGVLCSETWAIIGLLLVSFMNFYWPRVVWVLFHLCVLQTLILLSITCVSRRLIACIFIFLKIFSCVLMTFKINKKLLFQTPVFCDRWSCGTSYHRTYDNVTFLNSLKSC